MTDTITLPRDLVEHCATELKHQCGGRCNAEYNPCWAIELSDKLRAALAQQSEQGWKPIETAPKDGEEILLGGPDGSITVAHWNRRINDFLYDGDYEPTWATHWMPLPAAPKGDV